MTTSYPVFQSRAEHYLHNIQHANETTAGPATMTGPNGEEPAVILRHKRYIQAIYPISEAMRIATEIADSIAYHREAERG